MRLAFRISLEGILLEGSPFRDWDSVVPGCVLGISYFQTLENKKIKNKTLAVPVMCPCIILQVRKLRCREGKAAA